MNIMINKHNVYKIEVAGKKYSRSISLPAIFQDPYKYRMKDMYLAAYSISNIYKVYMCNGWR